MTQQNYNNRCIKILFYSVLRCCTSIWAKFCFKLSQCKQKHRSECRCTERHYSVRRRHLLLSLPHIVQVQRLTRSKQPQKITLSVLRSMRFQFKFILPQFIQQILLRFEKYSVLCNYVYIGVYKHLQLNKIFGKVLKQFCIFTVKRTVTKIIYRIRN